MSKPLTKALHTVRVVEAIAQLLVAVHSTMYRDTDALLVQVLNVLDNAAPTDADLLAKCRAVCNTALNQAY